MSYLVPHLFYKIEKHRDRTVQLKCVHPNNIRHYIVFVCCLIDKLLICQFNVHICNYAKATKMDQFKLCVHFDENLITVMIPDPHSRSLSVEKVTCLFALFFYISVLGLR